ncbi:MAG: DUF4384 domain-containing protein [Alphaproteobacteria bacterium]|nr:DUF4384 domain-containing protein [Alphaproteobacteria bacterium]MBU4544993.1 DUF4384 domain-containing protein [Alphaproteobacteria bacterium]MBU4549405.1 DUF4384 domain-containing protein [Alphaproteobacteria bacterium]
MPRLGRQLLLIAALLAVPTAPAGAQYFTGATLDPQVYQSVAKAAPLSRGSYASLPPRASLKAFAPTPGDQGNQGSCVGWAVGYAARTLAEARRLSVDERPDIDRTRFSPSFIYNQIRLGSCDDGSYPSDALDLLARTGVPLMRDFPYDARDCARLPTSEDLSRAGAFRIKGYKRLFSSGSTAKHVAVRRSLANGHPVVIGMMVSDAFMQSGERYVPAAGDLAALRMDQLGGHAMTVIGYDDTKFGGAFEVINSWGREWGNDGFVWVTYTDFNAFVMEGYELIPPDPPKPPRVVDMGGSLRFLHISGRDMPARALARPGAFRLADPYPSGTRFRVEGEARQNGYLYVIGGDRSGRFVELFPRDRGVSAHLSPGSALLVPGPSEDFFTRLNDTAGTDYYIALFAREPLSAASIAEAMTAAHGTVEQRLDAVLGASRVASAEIERTGSGIAFSAASDGRSVVPLVVEIEHVEATLADADRDPPLIVVSEPLADELEQVVANDPVRIVSSPLVRITGAAQDEAAIQRVTVEGALATKFSSRGPFEAEIEVPADGAAHAITITAVDALGNLATRTIRVQVAP